MLKIQQVMGRILVLVFALQGWVGLHAAAAEIPTCKPCRIVGMFGEQPIQFCNMIVHLLVQSKMFKEKEVDNSKKIVHAQFKQNRLLLHGRSGLGKSTFVEKFAAAADRNLIRVTGSSLVKGVAGSGPSTIRQLVDQAETHYENKKQLSIIFIDEVDSIAATNDSEQRQLQHDTNHELNAMLDDPRYEHIFFVFATNKYKGLMPQFIKRFDEDQIMEVLIPNFGQRNEAFNHFFNQNGIKVPENDLVDYVKKSEGLVLRSIEQVVGGAVKKVQETNDGQLKTIVNDKIQYYLKRDVDFPEHDEITNLRELRHQQASEVTIFQNAPMAADVRKDLIKRCFGNAFNDEELVELTGLTKFISRDFILRFVDDLATEARSNNRGVVTMPLAKQVLEKNRIAYEAGIAGEIKEQKKSQDEQNSRAMRQEAREKQRDKREVVRDCLVAGSALSVPVAKVVAGYAGAAASAATVAQTAAATQAGIATALCNKLFVAAAAAANTGTNGVAMSNVAVLTKVAVGGKEAVVAVKAAIVAQKAAIAAKASASTVTFFCTAGVFASIIVIGGGCYIIYQTCFAEPAVPVAV